MNILLQTVKNWVHWGEALAAVVYYRYPAKRLTVIGVTGTDGKTTTSTLIYHLLKAAGYKVALISTVAAYIGSEQIDTGFHVTSPGPWQLQQLLRRIVDQGYTYIVLEATSHGFDQHRLEGTNIRLAVVTNITHEHLDYHQTYDRYVAAKAKIFSHATKAIINRDDASYPKLLPYIPVGCQRVEYSTHSATVYDAAIKQRFPEPFNHANALAAIAVATHFGIKPPIINAALASFPGVPGRMQSIKNQKGILAIVDFAHTPNGLKAALTAVRPQTKGKLIVVFGAAGARDVSKRPMMGAIASELADEVIVTAEDPRHEDVRLIINQIKEGATGNRGHLHAEPDRRQAIRLGLSLAQPGDAVIVCGKGHEQSLNLDGVHELPWSDVKVMDELINKS